MALDLDVVIERVFRCTTSVSRDGLLHSPTQTQDDSSRSRSIFMEIPTDKDIIEIPVFVFQTFVESLNFPTTAIVAELYTIGNEPRYKTVDRFMRDILKLDFSYHLITLPVKQGDDTIIYYGTHGAVFDKDFSPIMMCSWLLEKVVDGDSIKYRFLHPILRIHPGCFLNPVNSMEKFIAKKLPTAALTLASMESPFVVLNCFVGVTRCRPLKVEIAANPFTMTNVCPPPLDITNKELLQTAIDHIDEFI